MGLDFSNSNADDIDRLLTEMDPQHLYSVDLRLLNLWIKTADIVPSIPDARKSERLEDSNHHTAAFVRQQLQSADPDRVGHLTSILRHRFEELRRHSA